MKLKPTLDRVVIKVESLPATSAGGIILPKAKDKDDGEELTSNYGVVLAVGPGGYNADGSQRKMPFKHGDKVFFTAYSLCETPDGLVIVEESDILAVMEV